MVVYKDYREFCCTIKGYEEIAKQIKSQKVSEDFQLLKHKNFVEKIHKSMFMLAGGDTVCSVRFGINNYKATEEFLLQIYLYDKNLTNGYIWVRSVDGWYLYREVPNTNGKGIFTGGFLPLRTHLKTLFKEIFILNQTAKNN